jgi:1,2-dihydroxy-3-keto-5-methylthiopentene dioxygenase
MKKKLAIVLILFCSFFQMQAAQLFHHSMTTTMKKLRVYEEKGTSQLLCQTSNYVEISSILGSIGIRFEKWRATKELAKRASDEDIIKAYKEDVDRLIRENGYKSVDVVRIFPDSPKKVELRQKFQSEHNHAEDEVRFFVEGSALFYIHFKNKVYIVLCEKGDLISIPAKYAHWFDMGKMPYFTAIRFFTNADGWIANFTGSDISQYFPKFEE